MMTSNSKSRFLEENEVEIMINIQHKPLKATDTMLRNRRSLIVATEKKRTCKF